MTLIRRFLCVAFAASLVSMSSAQENKLKIATVDMQELFKQYHGTEKAQKQFNTERARVQKDNNERLARIRELETNLGNLKKQIEDPSINDSKKQALVKDLCTYYHTVNYSLRRKLFFPFRFVYD